MRRRKPVRPIERLEGRRLPATLIGLQANDVLIRVDSASPGQLQATLPITGLAAGEDVDAIAFRPSTGQLYGLGSNADLYKIDPATGRATAAGPRFAVALSGTKFDLTFDGSTDFARVVSDAGQDFRVDPDTSQVTIDANLLYPPFAPFFGSNPRVVAAAYTDVAAVGQAAPTLYAIDQAIGQLVRIGSPNGTPRSAGLGELTAVGPLGASTTTSAALDIATTPDGLVAYAALGDAALNTSTLNTINLATGASTLVGPIAGGRALIDLAIAPRVETLFALSGANLVRVRADAPSSPITQSTIQGLPAGTLVAAIAYRPADGLLYGLGRAGDGSSSLYTIDLNTARATRLGPLGGAASFLAGRTFAMTYDANAAAFRVVDDRGDNLRIDPTSLVATADHALNYAPGDPNAGRKPALGALAATTADPTTLIGYDPGVGSLVRLTNPAAGTLSTVLISGPIEAGPHALAAGNGSGFYAEPDPNLAGSTILHRFDTGTGRRIPLGDFTGPIASLAVAPAGAIGFAVASQTVDSAAGVATLRVVRTGGSSGAVSVRFTTIDTAPEPLSYRPSRGVLTFAPGQTESAFLVGLIHYPIAGRQTVVVALTDDYGGATPGPITATTLTVVTAAPTAVPSVVAIAASGPFRGVNGLDLRYDLGLDASKLTAGQVAVFGVTGGRRPVPSRLGVASTSYDAGTMTVHLNFAAPVNLAALKSLRIVAPGEVSTLGTTGRGVDVTLPILQGRVIRYRDADRDLVTLSARGRVSLGVLIGPPGDALQAWVVGGGGAIGGQVARRGRVVRSTTLGRLVLGSNRDELPSTIVVQS